ncbi:hypothetical protein V8B97DRAFT_1920324 [Scleroderma yunnanense]
MPHIVYTQYTNKEFHKVLRLTLNIQLVSDSTGGDSNILSMVALITCDTFEEDKSGGCQVCLTPISFNPWETVDITTCQAIELQYPPAYMLVQMYHTKASALETWLTIMLNSVGDIKSVLCPTKCGFPHHTAFAIATINKDDAHLQFAEVQHPHLATATMEH